MSQLISANLYLSQIQQFKAFKVGIGSDRVG